MLELITMLKEEAGRGRIALHASIEELLVPVALHSHLMLAEIYTIGDLLKLSELELGQVLNSNQKSVATIEEALRIRGRYIGELISTRP